MTYEAELKQWKRKCLAEGYKKGLAEGLAEGEKKAKEEIIINLAQIHMPKEKPLHKSQEVALPI